MLSILQKRFLKAYSEEPTIAGAARLAGVHRASVYRWRADPAFIAAMDQAFEAWHKAHLARLKIQDAAKAEQKRRREEELRPMRIEVLRRGAWAAKRRKRRW